MAQDETLRAHRSGARTLREGLKSPAERLRSLPVNYYGAVRDTASERRPRLDELTAPHTLFLGATGSGKTLGMKLHMKSVLPPVAPDYGMNFRSLVYDAKSDMLPFLERLGFNLQQHIILTNPFDERAAAWDIADDVDNPADSQAFADIIIPDGQGEEFWRTSAREMVSACIDGLNAGTSSARDGIRWTLRQLVLVLDHPEALRQILDRTDHGRGVRRDYLDASDNRLRANLNATLRSHVAPFRLVAALWDHASHSFSLRQWASGGGLLLVGDNYRYKESMTRTNNAIVRYAIDTLMSREDEEKLDLTWLYLDELKNAGKFPNFGTMLTQGRSKGIRAVLAAQGISTLKATFAENEEQEVLNNVGNKAIMQLGSDEDARWAERLFSTVERVRTSWNVPEDTRYRGSKTFTEQRESRVPASKFLSLPSASGKLAGLTAYYHGPGPQASISTVSEAALNEVLPLGQDCSAGMRGFAPRDKSAFELRPLKSADYETLGIQADSPSSQSEGERSARTFRPPPQS